MIGECDDHERERRDVASTLEVAVHLVTLLAIGCFVVYVLLH